LDEDVAREMDELAEMLGGEDLNGLANIPESESLVDTTRSASIERELDDLPESQSARPTPLQAQTQPYQFDSFGEQTLLDSLEELDQLHKKLQ